MTPADFLGEGSVYATQRGLATDDGPIEAMEDTVTQASGALDELQDLFKRMKSLMVLAREQQLHEEKIGELFIRAQDYVNEALADAEARACQLIADAEFEAAQIVDEARDEARRIINEARRATALPPEAVRQLQATIEGFARLNRELLGELTHLGEALASYAQPRLPTPPAATPPPPPGLYVQLPPPPRRPSPPAPPSEANGYWSTRRRPETDRQQPLEREHVGAAGAPSR
jgi:hypothetical protein